MPRATEMVGFRSGMFTVIARAGIKGVGAAAWLCRCDCGTEKVIRGQSLRNGDSRSCGCRVPELVRLAKTKHGKHATPTYKVWTSMRERCANRGAACWPRYGGRGIKVCERWNSFENFLADMGERQPGMQVDRIDNDGDYEPGNCRWASRLEQGANKRCNHRITINGVTMHLAEWSRRASVSPPTMRARIRRGWDPLRAITEPIKSWSVRL